MNWYHITVAVFSRSSRGLVLFSLQVVTPEKPGLGVPAHGRGWRRALLICNSMAFLPEACVCWRFYTLPYCVTELGFPGVYFGGYVNSRVNTWGFWCPALPALPQWQKLGFVCSERTDRLDFSGVCVSGLILVYTNVKLQPSIPCVPLENVNAFRLRRIWGKVVMCLSERLGSMGQSQVIFRAIPCECPYLRFNLHSEFPGGLDTRFISQFGGRWEGSWRTGCVHVHVAPPAWRWQMLEWIGKVRGAGQLDGCEWVWWEEFSDFYPSI